MELTEHIINKLATKNVDMKGRRTSNAGNAKDLQDYVTLNDINNAISKATGRTIQSVDSNLLHYATKADLAAAITGISFPNFIGSRSTLSLTLDAVAQNGTKPVIVTLVIDLGISGEVDVKADVGINPPTTVIAKAVSGITAGYIVPVTFCLLSDSYVLVSSVSGSPSIVSGFQWF